jgi:hypothetical protein
MVSPLHFIAVAMVVSVVGGCANTVASSNARKIDAIALIAKDLAEASYGENADVACLSVEQRTEFMHRSIKLTLLRSSLMSDAIVKQMSIAKHSLKAATDEARNALEKCESEATARGTLDVSTQCNEQHHAVADPSRDLPRSLAMTQAMFYLSAQMRAVKRLRAEYPSCASEK